MLVQDSLLSVLIASWGHCSFVIVRKIAHCWGEHKISSSTTCIWTHVRSCQIWNQDSSLWPLCLIVRDDLENSDNWKPKMIRFIRVVHTACRLAPGGRTVRWPPSDALRLFDVPRAQKCSCFECYGGVLRPAKMLLWLQRQLISSHLKMTVDLAN